ncbi:MAG: hypothetical protein GY862_13645 [Gammaproteobacteria bacterium]|nr:hypothetical protein [Gammaproteobacteria bacterium]
MSFQSLWDYIKLFVEKRRAQATMGRVYAEKDFYRLLERECARTDRSGIGFSLVIFDMGETEVRNIPTHRLLRMLVKRTRFTDELGWLNGQNVGVILCGTVTHKSAQIFANNIWEMIASPGPSPECDVFIYPHDWRNVDHCAQGSRKTWMPAAQENNGQ